MDVAAGIALEAFACTIAHKSCSLCVWFPIIIIMCTVFEDELHIYICVYVCCFTHAKTIDHRLVSAEMSTTHIIQYWWPCVFTVCFLWLKIGCAVGIARELFACTMSHCVCSLALGLRLPDVYVKVVVVVDLQTWT